jgi:hypothetical protein
MDSIKPFCAGLSEKVSEMKGAMAPLSTQMQHENAKYRNAANKVGECPDFKKVRKPAMVHFFRDVDELPKRAQETFQLGALASNQCDAVCKGQPGAPGGPPLHGFSAAFKRLVGVYAAFSTCAWRVYRKSITALR